VTTAAGAHDQQLVLYYAASIFTSLLAGLLAIARRPAGTPTQSFVTKLIRAIVVAFTLLVNLARGKPRGTANARATEHHD
jgi:hypothetical protein